MDAATVNSLMSLDPRIRNAGRIHSGPGYVSLSSTSNTLLLTLPDGATAYLYCLQVFNRNASSVELQIGTGSTLTQRIPRLGPFLTGYHQVLWLPLHRFESDIYVTSSAGAASPNDVEVSAYGVVVS